MSYYETFLKKIPKLKRFLDNDCSDLIYHYTKPEKLLNIISHKTLRLSNVLFLNDKAEVSYAYGLILDLVKSSDFLDSELSEKIVQYFTKKYKNIIDGNIDISQQEYYTISFSTEKDNLVLWNNYSKEKTYTGYNIGFDINDVMCDIYKKQYNAICGCVIYKEKKQKNILTEILKHWNTKYIKKKSDDIFNELIDILSLASVFFKNNKFKDEMEYRIVIVNNSKYDMLPEPTKITEKNGLFVPYIEYKFSKKALKTINIGPTMNETVFYTSTNRMLLNFGFSKVTVLGSKIPLRY